MFLYGNEWKRVQQHIKTRSSTQARSHAQKFFEKIGKIQIEDFFVDFTTHLLCQPPRSSRVNIRWIWMLLFFVMIGFHFNTNQNVVLISYVIFIVYYYAIQQLKLSWHKEMAASFYFTVTWYALVSVYTYSK